MARIAYFPSRTGGPLKRRKRVIREITIETTETILAAREGSSITPSHCQQCGEGSRLVPFAEAVVSLGIDAFTLHRWLNEGRIHFQLTENSGLAICWATLSAQLEKQREISNPSPFDPLEKSALSTKRTDRTAPKQARGRGPRRPS